MVALNKNRVLEYQMNCIELNLTLAQKWISEGKTELAGHRVQDARKSLEELFKGMKKAN